MEESIAQFCAVTGSSYLSNQFLTLKYRFTFPLHSVREAKKFIEKFKRVDVAIDAYYNDPPPTPPLNTSKLHILFDKYKG
jgi:DCN1-like protein 1/2